MKLIYDSATKSFTKAAQEYEQAARSPYDWERINASHCRSGIYHYTDVKGFFGIFNSGYVAVSSGGPECYGMRRPVVWLTRGSFENSSIAVRGNSNIYNAGFTSNSYEYDSMIGHHFGVKVKTPKTTYVPVRFELCGESLASGSVSIVTWSEYKDTGFANAELACTAESGNKLAKADPFNEFLLSYESIPVYCFIEPKIRKGEQWVSINELDSIMSELPDGCFADARIMKDGEWIPVKDVPCNSNEA